RPGPGTGPAWVWLPLGRPGVPEPAGNVPWVLPPATAGKGNRGGPAPASTATSRNPARSKTLVKKTVHAVPVSGLVSAAAVQILPSERHVRTSGDANAHSSAG